MTMAISHLLTAAITLLIGIWVGRKTGLLSTLIKPG